MAGVDGGRGAGLQGEGHKHSILNIIKLNFIKEKNIIFPK